MGQHESEYKQRCKVVEELREAGFDPFDAEPFVPTHHAAELLEGLPPPEDEAGCARFEEDTFRVAGRVVSKRRQGKAGFLHLQDQTGRIQGYVRIDEVGPEQYERYKKTYAGDIVGLEGGLFRTNSGEVSLKVRGYHLLGKALRPLPEKWKGLKDKEKRYRQRYLDLIANAEVRDAFLKRSRMISATRRFLEDRGFMEVENPVLHVIPGGAEARPFVTHHNALDMDFYLRIAHELHLKRLLVGGMEKVYELGKVFRNEGVSPRHNPEFTMLEAYWAYATCEDWMDATEELMRELAVLARGSTRFEYKGVDIDLGEPWRRVSYEEALQEHAGCGLADFVTPEAARATAARLGVEVEDDASHGKLIDSVFSHFVEPHLGQPTFVYDYPLPLSPLARRKRGTDDRVLRFEGFLAHMEVCNSFTELYDPFDQRARFEEQAGARAAGDEEAHAMDEDFLLAIEHGMPPAAGIGYGLDRLFMILLGVESIRDVILFPHMKPREDE